MARVPQGVSSRSTRGFRGTEVVPPRGGGLAQRVLGVDALGPGPTHEGEEGGTEVVGLVARGLRHVSPHEAGIITLLEPLLNPLWAYLITPEKDTPTPAMWLGGGLILAALVWRYVPDRVAGRNGSPG